MKRGIAKNKSHQPTGDLIALGSKSGTSSERPSGTFVGTNKTTNKGYVKYPSLNVPAKAILPTLNVSKILSSYEHKAKEVPISEFLERVVKAKESNNNELCDHLILGAIKCLKKFVTPSASSIALGLNYQVKPELNQILSLSLMGLAKNYPAFFFHKEILEAFCSLLHRDNLVQSTTATSLMSHQSKAKFSHFSNLSVVICNILCVAYIDEEDWPELFIKVYVEDAMHERMWVDNIECKSYVDNITTAFNTKLSSIPIADKPQLPKLNENLPIFPRYLTLQPHIETFVTHSASDYLTNASLNSGKLMSSTPILPSAMENPSKHFLKFLMKVCCYPKVRLMAMQRIENWLQNPKLVGTAQDLLATLCCNMNGEAPEDQECLAILLKIRFQKTNKPGLLQHYMTCLENLLLVDTTKREINSDIFSSAFKLIVLNELSSSRNPNNTALIEFCVRLCSFSSAQTLAQVFLALLCNLEDYVRALKALYKEITRTVKYKFDYSTFAKTLLNVNLTGTDVYQPLIELDSTLKDRFLSSLIELLTFNSYLTFTPFIKESYLQWIQSRSNDPNPPEIVDDQNSQVTSQLRDFKSELREMRTLSVSWLCHKVIPFYRSIKGSSTPSDDIGMDDSSNNNSMVGNEEKFFVDSLVKLYYLSESETLLFLKELNLPAFSCNPNPNSVSSQSFEHSLEKQLCLQFLTRQSPVNLETIHHICECAKNFWDISVKEAVLNAIHTLFNRSSLSIQYRLQQNVSGEGSSVVPKSNWSIDASFFKDQQIFTWPTDPPNDPPLTTERFLGLQDGLLSLTVLPVQNCFKEFGNKFKDIDEYQCSNVGVSVVKLYWKVCLTLVTLVSSDPQTYGPLVWNPFSAEDSGKDLEKSLEYCLTKKASFPSPKNFAIKSALRESRTNSLKSLGNVLKEFKLLSSIPETITASSSSASNKKKMANLGTTTPDTNTLGLTRHLPYLEDVIARLERATCGSNSSALMDVAYDPNSCDRRTKDMEDSNIFSAESLVILPAQAYSKGNDIMDVSDEPLSRLGVGDAWDLMVRRWPGPEENSAMGGALNSEISMIDIGNSDKSFLKALEIINETHKVGFKLCSCRHPDILLDLIKLKSAENGTRGTMAFDAHNADLTSRSSHGDLDWLSNLIENNQLDIINVLPMDCLCRYLMSELEDFQTSDYRYSKFSDRRDDLPNSFEFPREHGNGSEIFQLLKLSGEILIARMDAIAPAGEQSIKNAKRWKSHSSLKHVRINQILAKFHQLATDATDDNQESMEAAKNASTTPETNTTHRDENAAKKLVKKTEIMNFFGEHLCHLSSHVRTQSYKILSLFTLYDTFTDHICLRFGSLPNFLSSVFSSNPNSTDPVTSDFLSAVYSEIFLVAPVIWGSRGDDIATRVACAALSRAETDPVRVLTYLKGLLEYVTKSRRKSEDAKESKAHEECVEETTEGEGKAKEGIGLKELAFVILTLSDFIIDRFEILTRCLSVEKFGGTSDSPENGDEVAANNDVTSRVTVKLFVSFIQQALKFQIETNSLDSLYRAMLLCEQNHHPAMTEISEPEMDAASTNIAKPLLKGCNAAVSDKLARSQLGDTEEDMEPFRILQRHFLPPGYCLVLPAKVVTANLLLILAVRNKNYGIPNFEELEHLTQFWFPSSIHSNDNIPPPPESAIISIFPLGSIENVNLDGAIYQPRSIIDFVPFKFRTRMLYCHHEEDEYIEKNSVIVDMALADLTSFVRLNYKMAVNKNSDNSAFYTQLFGYVQLFALPKYTINKLLDMLDHLAQTDLESVKAALRVLNLIDNHNPTTPSLTPFLRMVKMRNVSSPKAEGKGHVFLKLVLADENGTDTGIQNMEEAMTIDDAEKEVDIAMTPIPAPSLSSIYAKAGMMDEFKWNAPYVLGGKKAIISPTTTIVDEITGPVPPRHLEKSFKSLYARRLIMGGADSKNQEMIDGLYESFLRVAKGFSHRICSDIFSKDSTTPVTSDYINDDDDAINSFLRFSLDWIIRINSTRNIETKAFDQLVHIFFAKYEDGANPIIPENGVHLNTFQERYQYYLPFQRFGLSLICHEAGWNCVGKVIEKLLDMSGIGFGLKAISPQNMGYHPTLVLDFLQNCLELPRIWQGRDMRNKKKYEEELILDFDENQFKATLVYVIREYNNDSIRENAAATKYRNETASPRVDKLLRHCLLTKPAYLKVFVKFVCRNLAKLELTVKSVTGSSNDRSSFLAITQRSLCRLAYETYLRFPKSLHLYSDFRSTPSLPSHIAAEEFLDKTKVNYLRYDFEDIGPNYFRDIVTRHPYTLAPSTSNSKISTSPLEHRYTANPLSTITDVSHINSDSTLFTVITQGLDRNIALMARSSDKSESLTIQSDRAKEFVLTICKYHPHLILRHLPLMNTLLQGRTHLTYPAFIAKGHFTFFKTIILIAHNLQPHLFYYQTYNTDALMDTFFDFVKTYSAQTYKMGFHVKRIMNLTKNYILCNPSSGKYFSNTKSDIIKNLGPHYHEIIQSPFWKARTASNNSLLLTRETTKKSGGGGTDEDPQHAIPLKLAEDFYREPPGLSFQTSSDPKRNRAMMERLVRVISCVPDLASGGGDRNNDVESQAFNSLMSVNKSSENMLSFLKEFLSYAKSHPDIVEPFLKQATKLLNSQFILKSTDQKYLDIILDIITHCWRHLSEKSMNGLYRIYWDLISSSDPDIIKTAFQYLPQFCNMYPEHFKDLLIAAFISEVTKSLSITDTILKAIKVQRT
ncbi:uncharacterized protein LOC135923255 isoform X2 [Gordionus sp. m RMFG-2023]|uniref:uncharacterized protein LOC135923255 isoform X2 n=1 Tax=Gordionus sp. m RMFG-2023 TaxID=3053472 RepID=UPI0031FC510F